MSTETVDADLYRSTVTRLTRKNMELLDDVTRLAAENSRLRADLETVVRDLAMRFDFQAHLARQAEFSARTFGPGPRVEGITDHIRRELIEVVESGGSLSEWIDVVILGLDGAWRSGATPDEIIAALVGKQARNETRAWPDWRTAPTDKAIEHVRDETELQVWLDFADTVQRKRDEGLRDHRG